MNSLCSTSSNYTLFGVFLSNLLASKPFSCFFVDPTTFLLVDFAAFFAFGSPSRCAVSNKQRRSAALGHRRCR